MENGKIRECMVKVGDNVMLPEYGGSSVTIGEDKQELFIYRDDDILGILEEKLAQWVHALDHHRVTPGEIIGKGETNDIEYFGMFL